ncbi:RNA-binding protein [Nocardioides dongxiaopingii]|uniref:CGNR zinc finger domain-containing protein n=1 Tax=Nocardioides sp. S-1144 TaxID=2582905 RepID=UPI00110EB954|nr:CGNR zinc finger domain-containing protein [Nocardioides sp. S-1144]QCW50554.1 RNA-binding protein [Nocardioides sp. S-1144]
MVFAHDVELSLQSAVVLANSALDPVTISTVEELSDFYRKHHFSGRHDRDAAERDAVLALRAEFRTLLTASREDAVGLVNRMLAEEQALPQLMRHDEFDWHLHAVSPDAPWATRFRVELAMAMIDVIRGDEMSRLGVCGDDECEGVVLDLSRNRSRRFCSTTCGNRNAVAAYRARQAGA